MSEREVTPPDLWYVWLTCGHSQVHDDVAVPGQGGISCETCEAVPRISAVRRLYGFPITADPNPHARIARLEAEVRAHRAAWEKMANSQHTALWLLLTHSPLFVRTRTAPEDRPVYQYVWQYVWLVPPSERIDPVEWEPVVLDDDGGPSDG